MQTAEEYLKHLQKQYATHSSISHSNVKKLLASFNSKPDIKAMFEAMPEEKKKQFLEQASNAFTAFQPIIDELKATILSSVEQPERALLEKIPVGALHTYDANAWTIEAPDGAPVILLNNGVMGFTHDMTRIIASRIKTVGVEEIADYSDHILTLKATISCLHFLSDARVGGDHFVSLSALQNEYGRLMTHDVELFILAHEFGHNALRHQHDIILKKGPEGDEGARIKYYQRSWEAEYEADRWAVSVLSAIAQAGDWRSPFTLVAPSIFFSALSFLEEVAGHFSEINKALSIENAANLVSPSTHPPALSRRSAVEEMLYDALSEQDQGFVPLVAGLFNELSQRLAYTFSLA
jgi:hypothetical protein